MADYRITITSQAEQDARSIFEWIAARSPEGARRWYQTFHSALNRLRGDPQQFPVAAESKHFAETVRNQTFRMRSGKTYRILFSIEGDQVLVLFVRAPGQDLVKP